MFSPSAIAQRRLTPPSSCCRKGAPQIPQGRRWTHYESNLGGCLAVMTLTGAHRSVKSRRRKAASQLQADSLHWMQPLPQRQRKRRSEEYSLIQVPIRKGACNLALKRFSVAATDGSIPRARPALLVIHDGPGLPSRYLEPLAAQITESSGYSCFLYDQLGCGLSKCAAEDAPGHYGLLQSVEDLRNLLYFLQNELNEQRVHLVGHGFGGVLLMEALLRHGLYDTEVADTSALPNLCSVTLLSTPSSMAVAEQEAARLMKVAEDAVGQEDAPHSFWCRHNCAIYPQPECLKEAYRCAAERSAGWWCAGALQVWRPCLHEGCSSNWELQGANPLASWEISEAELKEKFSKCTGRAPLLSIRGSHDFITEDCVRAWQGAGRDPSGVVFCEDTVGGAGHQLHLDAPRVFVEKLNRWLRQVDDEVEAAAEAPDTSKESVDVTYTTMGRDEAHEQLAFWASSLARAPTEKREEWAFHWSLTPRKLEDKYWVSPVPAREARRLADWARELPQSTRQCGSVSAPRAAIRLLSREQGKLDAIVCLERLRFPWSRVMRIVGAASAPDTAMWTRDAAVQHVRQMLSESGVRSVSAFD